MDAPGDLTGSDVESLVAAHVGRVAEALPEASVSLSGSTLLGEFHGHDIDLVALVPSVPHAAERLRRIYPPLYEEEWRDDWAAFRDVGPPQVDIVVTRCGTKGDAHHRRAWDLLLADESLRVEYMRRKAAGMTGADKADFFDQLVAMLGDEQ